MLQASAFVIPICPADGEHPAQIVLARAVVSLPEQSPVTKLLPMRIDLPDTIARNMKATSDVAWREEYASKASNRQCDVERWLAAQLEHGRSLDLHSL